MLGTSKPHDVSVNRKSSQLSRNGSIARQSSASSISNVMPAAAPKTYLIKKTGANAKSNNGAVVSVGAAKSSVLLAVLESAASSTVQQSDKTTRGCDGGDKIQSKKATCDDQSNRRLSDVNEPTKQPISARRAAWQKKAAVSDETTLKPGKPIRAKLLSTIAETEKAPAAVRNGPVAAHLKQLHPTNNKPAAVQLNRSSSVLRHAAVKNNVSDEKQNNMSKLKGQISQPILPKKEVETTSAGQSSAKKLGLATHGIQEKLSAMCENWKKNEIAEKLRLEREAEMAVLESRWKNGILVDYSTVSETAVSVPSTVAEPPVSNQVF